VTASRALKKSINRRRSGGNTSNEKKGWLRAKRKIVEFKREKKGTSNQWEEGVACYLLKIGEREKGSIRGEGCQKLLEKEGLVLVKEKGF